MKEHFVPQFYSKRWLYDKQHKGYCYSFRHGQVVSVPKVPKTTGYGHNIYAKMFNDKVSNDVEISHYKTIDTKASGVLDNLIQCSSGYINEDIKNKFSLFVISMLFRHPIAIQNSMRSMRKIFRKPEFKYLDPFQYYSFPKEFHSTRNNCVIDVHSSFTGYANQYGVDNSNKYIDCLMGLEWYVFDFSTVDLSIITSDYPVSFYQLTQNGDPNVIDNLTKGHWVLSIPLSPKHCLYIGKNISSPISREPATKLLKEQNQRTIKLAKFFIYTIDNSQENYIKKNFNSKEDINNYSFMSDENFKWLKGCDEA